MEWNGFVWIYSWKSISVLPTDSCHMKRNRLLPCADLSTINTVALHTHESVLLLTYCWWDLQPAVKTTGEPSTFLAIWWRHCPASLCVGPTDQPLHPVHSHTWIVSTFCSSMPSNDFFFHLVRHVFPRQDRHTDKNNLLLLCRKSDKKK